jgi:hypothetical protein
LGLAIFRFGIADTDASTNEARPARANPFSIEAFEQSRGHDGASKAWYEPEPPPLEELTELLRKHANASAAEIDREEGRFRFSFMPSDGRPAPWDNSPWTILWEPAESLKLELKPRLEALLNNSGLISDYEAPYAGFARISDDEAAEGARRSEGVRFATGLVWNQLMRRAFDRAIKTGQVELFARWPSISDDFQKLPSDIWPLLEVLDWEHGVACDMQGTLYSSIHAADTATIDRSGGQSFETDDLPLIEEMRSLIAQGKAKNASDSARQVAPKAKRLGDIESAVERLRRAYGREYPTRKRS